MAKDKIKTHFEDIDTFSELVEFVANDLEYEKLMEPKDNVQEQDFWNGKGREVHLKNEDRTIVRIIRVEEDKIDLRDIKDRIKRKGRRNQELFTVFTYVNEDRNLAGKTRFFWLNRRLSEEDVDVEYDLRYFEANPENLEPVYIDYLDKLRVGDREINNLEADEGLKETFSIERLTDDFYEEFYEVIEDAEDQIVGLEDVDEHHYAQVLVNRMLFILFIEEKEWLSDDPEDYSGNKQYLEDKYDELREKNIDIWNEFFRKLFFEGLSHKGESPDIVGTVPYLNGGLFEEKEYEEDVHVEKEFFEALLNPERDKGGKRKGFLRRYKFKLSENNPSEQELVVDPEFIGKVFEMSMQGTEKRSEQGAFYTPKDITQYMSKNSIKQLLLNELPEKEEELSQLVLHHKIEDNFTEEELQKIHDELKEINVLDPAVGSGAFIIAVMEELVGIFEAINSEIGEEEDTYSLKEHMIANNLYGVDIDQAGIELCKFRTWLHLMQDLDINLKTLKQQNDKYALPNLDFKFFVGNSLSGDYKPIEAINKIKKSGVQRQLELTGDAYDSESFDTDFLNKIEAKRDEYTRTHDQDKKEELEQEINDLTEKIENSINWADTDYYMEEVVESSGDDFKWSVRMPEVMAEGGFDIVIANPPYQGRSDQKQDYVSHLSEFYSRQRQKYVTIPGMRHDLYQKFNFRGEELVSKNGIVSYITSDTFLTIGSKEGTRRILQQNTLIQVVDANPDIFDATVNPAIYTYRRTNDESNYSTLYVEGSDLSKEKYINLLREGFEDRRFYPTKINLFRNAPRRAFFTPNETNLSLLDNIHTSKELLEEWGSTILKSRKVEENLDRIKEEHISNLETGDISLVGLTTVGAQGLATGRNRDYIAYVEGSEKAEEIKEKNGQDFEYVVQNDNTVGVGKIGRVIKEDHIRDISEMTEDEKKNGIDDESKDTWIPIVKGKGKPYYDPINRYINWSKSSVEELKNSSRARWQGFRYFFKQGIFAVGQGTGDPVFRYNPGAIYDHSGNNLITHSDLVSEKYLLGLLNSSMAHHILDNFLNHTVNTQLTDFRMLPVKIPGNQKRKEVESYVEEAIEAQKESKDLEPIQEKIDQTFEEIYGVELDE